jgi:sodium-dependent dicarboxylate transporter 2/3/5
MTRDRILLSIGLLGFILALVLTGGSNHFVSAIAMCSLMVYLWITESVPIYVTALIPFIVGGPLGILDNDTLASAYGNKMVFLFLGGFILAMALEKWHVHKQVARIIIQAVGSSKPRILLGFLISTAFLSMWVSNTATALMMLPMALAVIAVLPPKEQKGKFAVFLLLSIAYAASIGGMGTLVGSPPNIVMAGILKDTFDVQVSFAGWMQIGVPISIILIAGIYLYFYVMMGDERKDNPDDFQLEKKPWIRPQKKVVIIFSGVVILWIGRDLIKNYFGLSYGDESAAILGSFLLFLVPGENNVPLLTWKDTEKLPWGILLLFGGGLALAGALEANGVIEFISTLFETFKTWDYFLLLTVIISIAIFGTEFMSNMALVTLFIPIIGAFAQVSQYDILQLCIPVTMAASCAFMLPVGTPPNAIVFSSGKISIAQMARVGVIFNLFALFVIAVAAYFFM